MAAFKYEILLFGLVNVQDTESSAAHQYSGNCVKRSASLMGNERREVEMEKSLSGAAGAGGKSVVPCCPSHQSKAPKSKSDWSA